MLRAILILTGLAIVFGAANAFGVVLIVYALFARSDRPQLPPGAPKERS